MKKLFTCLAALCLLAGTATAQNVVLEQDVNQDTIVPSFGPNYRHYFHYYLAYGMNFSTEDRGISDMRYGLPTWHFMFGGRYKYKVAEHYALGFDISYSRQVFGFKQRADKVFPSPGTHKKERLVLNNLGLELYNRINFGRRGNHLGRFVDVGAYGEWTFDNMLFIKEKPDSANALGAQKTKLKLKDLNYINSLNYGLAGRIGSGRVSVYGRYRLSDLLDPKKTNDYPELPRLTVGLQLSI